MTDRPTKVPAFPPNRVIREGEAVCPQCGSGRHSHADGRLGHAMPPTWWDRVVGFFK